MTKLDSQALAERRKVAEGAFSEVLKATNELLAPLRDLSGPQKDALVALGLLLRVISLGRRSSVGIGQPLLDRFARDVDGICPPLGNVAIGKDPCLEATISYLSALKECENAGKTEDNCPKAWEHAAAAIGCAMREVEALKRDIGERLVRQVPPKPIPWPITGV